VQDLKLRIESLEDKFNKEDREPHRESRNNRRMDESTSMLRNNKDDIIRRIKIDPPTFEGIHDPKVFIDWMAVLDCYFD